jgi:hypothetical protein
MFSDRCVYPRLQLKSLSHIVWISFHESKLYKKCIRIVGKHNKLENVIAIWDEPLKKVQP